MPAEFEVKPQQDVLDKRAVLSTVVPPGVLGNEFARKVAIVTGASRHSPMGIGAATALELARQGLKSVTITSTPASEQQARETAQHLSELGAEVLWLGVDQRIVAENQRVIDTTVERFGALHYVVGVAGARYDGLSVGLTEDTWDGAINLMLKGNHYLGAFAMRKCLKTKTLEAIVYVGSIVGEFGNKGQVSYAAAKAGLDGLVRSQSQEWGGRKVRVNLVSPGFVATEMISDLLDQPAVEDMVRKRISLGRMANPSEIANLIVFLLSPRASYITGAIYPIDGGLKPFAI